jgi:hypothetical protein
MEQTHCRHKTSRDPTVVRLFIPANRPASNVLIHSDLLCSTLPDLRRHKTHSSTESLMAMIEDIVSEWIAATNRANCDDAGDMS